MAIGTESMERVDLIAGPGNAYVAEAKRQLFGEVGIDLFAGPTEILIIADDDADPFTCRGRPAVPGRARPGVARPSWSPPREALGREVDRATSSGSCPSMPTRDYAEPAWRDFGQVIVVDDIDEAYRGGRRVRLRARAGADRRARGGRWTTMHNYGALFLGENTCVSYGDKVIGTNHVLPTLGAARYTGGLWVGKYLKTVTYQEVRQRRLQRRAGPGLRPGGAGRALRGPRPLRRRPGPAAPRATSSTGSTGRLAGRRADTLMSLCRPRPRWSPAAARARRRHRPGPARAPAPTVVLAGRRPEPLRASAPSSASGPGWRVCDVADPASVDRPGRTRWPTTRSPS